MAFEKLKTFFRDETEPELPNTGDLDQDISALRAQYSDVFPKERPTLSRKQCNYLDYLAPLLWRRFLRDGEAALADLNEFIEIKKRLAPELEGEARAQLLRHASIALERKFKIVGKGDVIDEAIRTQRECVKIMEELAGPDGFPSGSKDEEDYATYYDDLGTFLFQRWNLVALRGGSAPGAKDKTSDLNDSIAAAKHSTAILPAIYNLCNLSKALIQRFERCTTLDEKGKRDPSDLNQAIRYLEQAKDLVPSNEQGSREHFHTVMDLGNAFRHKYEVFGEVADLDQALTCLQSGAAYGRASEQSLSLSDRAAGFHNLNIVLELRFLVKQDPLDLDEGMKAIEQALALRETQGDAFKTAGTLNSLSAVLKLRFQQYGSMEDLERAISSIQRAIQIAPQHGDMPMFQQTLCQLLESRFQQKGILEDIETSVQLGRQAVESTPPLDAEYGNRLVTLGIAYQSRFKATANVSDIEQAIEAGKRGLEESERMFGSNSQQAKCHNNLGNSLALRFELKNDFDDLNAAVTSYRRAVDVLFNDPTHHYLPTCWDSLGNALRARFQAMHDRQDLDESILAYQRALSLLPRSNPRLPSILNNISGALLTRFRESWNPADLDSAMNYQIAALKARPRDSPLYLEHQTNLAHLLLERYREKKFSDDLKRSLELLHEIISQTPTSHPEYGRRLCDLANALMESFDSDGGRIEIDEAIELYQKSLSLPGLVPANLQPRNFRLGCAFEKRFKRGWDNSRQDYVQAIESFRQAIDIAGANPRKSYISAFSWAKLADSVGETEEAMKGYETAIALLPKLTWLGMSERARREGLEIIGLTNEAAACAIQIGRKDRAVELLEQGHSVLFNQALGLRIDKEKIYDVNPELASKLEAVGQSLEEDIEQDINRGSDSKWDNFAAHKQTLAREWDSTIEQVRQLPGFSDFLKPRAFDQLRHAAKKGPVIFINACKRRSDALILHPDGTLSVVPLPNLKDTEAIERAGKLRRALKKLGQEPEAVQKELGGTVKWLWKAVMNPIAEELDLQDPQNEDEEKPRIWLCPTGALTFLPLHAAGPYVKGQGKDISRRAVVSYTTTLSSLLDAPKSSVEERAKVAMISYQATGEGMLPSLTEEIESVRTSLTSPKIDFSLVSGDDANSESAGFTIRQSSWIHLSCHGTQNTNDPMGSFFHLKDSNLTLRDLASRSKTGGTSSKKFAFLSACQTAMGDESLPDEATHLAAGMQFVGFKSVIATMWSIRDDLVPDLAKDIYKILEENEMDSEKSAMALNKGIENVRKKLQDGKVKNQLCWWIPFIHLGF